MRTDERRMQQSQRHPQNGRKRKKMSKRKRQRRKIIFTIIMCILLLVILVFAGVLSKLSKMDKMPMENVDVNSDLDLESMKGYTTFALFGLDNRSNGDFKSGNSDSMIIVSIHNKTGKIKMCSLYRDTYLDIRGKGELEPKYRKANAAYAAGGPEQAVTMMNRNLDLNITDYVAVDFNGLVKTVNLLGGIDLDEGLTEEEAYYMNGSDPSKENYIATIQEVTGVSSEYVVAGQTHLDGVQATAYARIRYTTGWDFKRTERQRIVISKMFEKAKSSKLTTLNSAMNEILPEISTSLSTTEMLKLMSMIGRYNMGDNTGFPFNYESGSVGNLGDLVIPTDMAADVKQLHEVLYDDIDYEPSSTVRTISETIRANSGM